MTTDTHALQSAINTVRAWKARRKANGKPAEPEDVQYHIRTRWPGMPDDEVVEIMRGVAA